MRASFFLAFVLIACGAASCRQAAPNAEVVARACTPPRAHWMPQGNFDGLMPPILRLSMDRNGAIHWNGRVTSLSQLSGYLATIHTMRPEPIVFLETEMGAPCAAVEAVRDEMERRMHCSDHGTCAEGIWTVWQATPTPPGTPPS